jgi:DNA-binding transcriptional regulator YiaG
MKRMRSHFKIILEKRIKKMAFSTIMIGKKIANMRKEKNITQMELADAMGVSYQAVSNWERGNSMPDISKLPELVDH